MKNGKSWLPQAWRRFWYSPISKRKARHTLSLWYVKDSMRTRSERLIAWLQNRPSQHYGHKVRIPELFQRRDLLFHALWKGTLQIKASSPQHYHDLLDAAAKVGALEVRLGYTFKNRMTCIEALKVTGSAHPLYFDGTIHKAGRNNRLALLGDRVLSLAICELWFKTEHSAANHDSMSRETVSRSALAVTGRSLGLHHSVITASGPSVSPVHIAETFEAVLGAVYVDSGYDMSPVKAVLRRFRIDDHQFLKTQIETGKAKIGPVLSSRVDKRVVVSIATEPEQVPNQPVKQTVTTPAPLESRSVSLKEENWEEEGKTRKSVGILRTAGLTSISQSVLQEVAQLELIMDSRRGDTSERKDAIRALHKYASLSLSADQQPGNIMDIYREFRAATAKANTIAKKQKKGERERELAKIQRAEAKIKSKESRKKSGSQKRAQAATSEVEAEPIEARSKSRKATENATETAKNDVGAKKSTIEINEARSKSKNSTEAAKDNVQAKKTTTEITKKKGKKSASKSEIDLLLGSSVQDDGEATKAAATDHVCDEGHTTSGADRECSKKADRKQDVNANQKKGTKSKEKAESGLTATNIGEPETVPKTTDSTSSQDSGPPSKRKKNISNKSDPGQVEHANIISSCRDTLEFQLLRSTSDAITFPSDTFRHLREP